MKTFLTSGLVVLFVFQLIACDQNTAQKAKNKTDQAVESVDTQVKKVAQSSGIFQSTAKNLDDAVDQAHSAVHVSSADSTKKSPVSGSANQ